jgi:hypothetical protein
VGINMFSASASSANRDAIISGATNLGTMAQQFYKKPTALGGGGNTFTGWDSTKVPSSLLTTPNGKYSIAPGTQTVTITGIGTNTGNNGSTPVKVTVTVTPNSISTKVNN